MKFGLSFCWLEVGEVVVWLGTHDAWDLAFRIGKDHITASLATMSNLRSLVISLITMLLLLGQAQLYWNRS